MSRAKQHNQNNHAGHDYGARYKCNRLYGNSYGVNSRDKADIERRHNDKELAIRGL